MAEQLTDDEARALREIESRVTGLAQYNRDRRSYYEAHRKVQDLGISVPPSLKNTQVAVGWPGMVVDALDERLNINGLTGAADDVLESEGVRSLWRDNNLDISYSEGHVEALIQGVAFLVLSDGDAALGEPEQLITIESPSTMSGIYSPRRRSLDHAASFLFEDRNDPARYTGGTLLTRTGNVVFERGVNGQPVVVDRQEHDLGRVAARLLVNRPWVSRTWGRSEITRPVISYTDAAMRTLLGAEVAREFYGAPQRYLMGADEAQFKGKNEWTSYMGRFLALTLNEDGEPPVAGSFAASSPQPYIDLVKMYSQLVAGESGIPAPYFGFVHDNPTSADAIRTSESRHVKRAERRQRVFGAAWRGILLDAVQMRDGSVPAELEALTVDWVDAATPTKAAAADAVTKQIAAGALPATSDVALAAFGYNPDQIEQIKTARRAEGAQDIARGLRPAAQQAAQDPALARVAQARGVSG